MNKLDTRVVAALVFILAFTAMLCGMEAAVLGWPNGGVPLLKPPVVFLSCFWGIYFWTRYGGYTAAGDRFVTRLKRAVATLEFASALWLILTTLTHGELDVSTRLFGCVNGFVLMLDLAVAYYFSEITKNESGEP